MMRSLFGVILLILVLSTEATQFCSAQVTQSKVTYWSLTNALAYEGKAGLLDGLHIVRIDNLNMSDVTVVYQIGWTITVAGVITEFKPRIEGTWRWNDATFAVERDKIPTPGLTRIQDLLLLFYTKLAASNPAWAGTLIQKNVN